MPLSDFSAQTAGEWDVSVRFLTRILYFSDQHRIPGNGGALLDDNVRNHVRDYLLNVSGPAALRGELLLDAVRKSGERHRNTAGARGPARFLHDVGQSLEDLWDWLKHRWWLLLFLVPALAGLRNFTAGFYLSAAPAVVAAVVLVGASAAAYLPIPETENHLMQIESSRYLNNEADHPRAGG